jgi:hypothetical protein
MTDNNTGNNIDLDVEVELTKDEYRDYIMYNTVHELLKELYSEAVDNSWSLEKLLEQLDMGSDAAKIELDRLHIKLIAKSVQSKPSSLH